LVEGEENEEIRKKPKKTKRTGWAPHGKKSRNSPTEKPGGGGGKEEKTQHPRLFSKRGGGLPGGGTLRDRLERGGAQGTVFGGEP